MVRSCARSAAKNITLQPEPLANVSSYGARLAGAQCARVAETSEG